MAGLKQCLYAATQQAKSYAVFTYLLSKDAGAHPSEANFAE
jgi:hypothetical protein